MNSTSVSGTILSTTALALVAAGFGAATADAAQVREMRYLASLSGSMTTVWTEPRHPSPAVDDCFHTFFDQGRGQETWTFRQSKPTKMVVTRVGLGNGVSTHYGNFDPLSSGKKGVVVSSQLNRTFERIFESQPGPCGGTATTEVDDGGDCGNRGSGSYGDLIFAGGRATLRLHLSDAGYEDCRLLMPEPLIENAFPEIGPKMRPSELLDPRQGLHILIGRKTFRETLKVPQDGEIRTTTTVKWQLRLRRVK